MEILKGKGISPSLAVGRIRYIRKEQGAKKETITDAAAEWNRYEVAREKAAEELRRISSEAGAKVGGDASVFEIHAMLLEDGSYNSFIRKQIEEQMVSAAYAVYEAGEHFAGIFAQMEDEYFQARAADMRDISSRVQAILTGRPADFSLGDEPIIVAAEDLAPSETVQMDQKVLLGFVTERSSANSHTAILARTMGIPAVTGIAADPSWDGTLAVLDGTEGLLYLDPDEETLSAMRARQRAEQESTEALWEQRGLETVTLTGRKIHLYANAGSEQDAAAALQQDAEGIGLLRSEFLYLEKNCWPKEDELFESYRRIVQSMNGKKVIIRTIDIGADKQAPYFQLEKEENPALGYRAIRICLDRQELLRTQLRAIYRASAYGTVSILYPMIISVEEIRQLRQIASDVRDELRAENIPTGEVEQGIMIETPAAALISDLLAREVDFFSIGTNDLSQYTLAIDRQNEKLSRFFDPHHPAILRLIQMTIENAHKAGRWAGICGELAADLTLTDTFVSMGVDELSVTPSALLRLRKQIRSLS